jgi:hypothetical protein
MVNCRTSQSAVTQAENGRSKRNWSSSEISEIRSRTKQEQRRLELVKKVGSTEMEAQNLAELQRVERMVSEYEAVSTDLVSLLPQEFNKQENYLARTLGIHKKLLGLGDDFTQAGQVKLQIADMKQTAQNLIDVTARYAFKKTVNDAVKDIHLLLKKRGIDPSSAEEFINHVGEVAKSPRQRVSYGNSEAVNKVLTNRHNDMMAEAKALGLSTNDMDMIVSRLTTAMGVIDNTHTMGKVLGATADTVENIGYMMRTFTEKAEAFYKLKSVDIGAWSGGASVGKSSVQKSRESFTLVSDDYEVLAQYLTPGSQSSWNNTVDGLVKDAVKKHIDELAARPKKVKGSDIVGYTGDGSLPLPGAKERFQQLVDLHPQSSKYDLNKIAGRRAFLESIVENPGDYVSFLKHHGDDEVKALQHISDLTGQSVQELQDLRFKNLGQTVVDLHNLADDGLAFTEHIHKTLSGQQLDELVDAGILHKVEMTTREVAQYMAKQYDLPYQKAIGMFNYSIPERVEKYTDTLRRSAGEASLVKNIVTSGVDAGWAVPAALMNSIEHKGFVPLSGTDFSKFGIAEDVTKQWGGMYVHPTVKAQLGAYLDLATNPGKLSQFANAWSYVLRNFNLATLTASGVPFLARNVIGGTINFMAGGGNMARIIPGIHEYATVIGKGGLEALDNVNKIVNWPGTGELITKQEAFRRMFIKRGTDYVSAESGNKLGLNRVQGGVGRVLQYGKEALPITALPNAIKQQMEYLKDMGPQGWGLKEAAGLGAKQFDDYVRTTFAPIAYGNAVVDGGLKWAWVMTHLVTTDGLGNLDEAGKVLAGGKVFKDSLDMFDQMDQFFVNSYTTGTVQKTLSKYVVPFGSFAMSSTPMSIRHAIRNPNQFMAYSRMMRMNHRENMRDPDIREAGFSEFEMAAMPMTLFKDYKNTGQVLTLFPTNVDMYQGSLAYVGKQVQRVQRLTSEGGFIGDGNKDRSQLRDPYNLRQFVSDNLKDNQNPVVAMVSELLSGKDSLGRPIDKNTKTEVAGVSINPSVFWLLTKLPGFNTINTPLSGRGAITGPDGTIQAPAAPGLFGTPQREATRTEEAKYRASQFMGTEAYGVIKNLIGLDVRTIDLAEGRQHTLSDVRQTISVLQKKQNELKTATPSPETDKQRELVANQILQLKVDEYRVSEWMKKNNVPDPKALKKLNKDGITVRSLPINDTKTQQLIQEYMINSGRQPLSTFPGAK